jgi:hypothetical protein
MVSVRVRLSGLVFALLWAQWLGLSHAIWHSPLLRGAETHQKADAKPAHESHAHASPAHAGLTAHDSDAECRLFDQLAHSDALSPPVLHFLLHFQQQQTPKGASMPLITLWRATPEALLEMTLPTVVRMAIDPDNSLRDGSPGSLEFRQFLTEIDSKKLSSFATYCLENPFTDSGQVLQDIVNEIGRRMGFIAENGRYRGVRNDIGYDGIWRSAGNSLVVEVKTTDAYAISLDVIIDYRDRLVEESRIPKDTPILIVIGRRDTKISVSHRALIRDKSA